MSTKELLEMSPLELNDYLQKNIKTELPSEITTREDMEEAGKLLSIYTSYYSYFSQAALTAKIVKRSLKAEKKDKKLIDDALSREEIFTLYSDIMKQNYNAVSRMITIKLNADKEIQMTKYGS